MRTWLDGLRQNWSGDPERDEPERLAIFEAFCKFAGKDPDTIIEECVLERDREKRTRAKGRRRFAELITQFQSVVEGSRLKRGKWGSTVRPH